MAVLVFNDSVVNFSGSVIVTEGGQPIVNNTWTLKHTETWTDPSGWHHKSSESDSTHTIIKLEEPDTSASDTYQFATVSFKSIDLTKGAYLSMEVKGESSPVMLAYLVDGNGNLSNHMNLGRSKSDDTKLLITSATSGISDVMGSISSTYASMNTDISSYLNDSFDKTNVTGLKICIANWYKDSPSWKSRTKSAIFKSITISDKAG